MLPLGLKKEEEGAMVLEQGESWSLEEGLLERSCRNGETFLCLTIITKPRGSKTESNTSTSVSSHPSHILLVPPIG